MEFLLKQFIRALKKIKKNELNGIEYNKMNLKLKKKKNSNTADRKVV